jgi:lipopolysaccharide/colanic/teichoic acid biosynthesis glycosyltransferase
MYQSETLSNDSPLGSHMVRMADRSKATARAPLLERPINISLSLVILLFIAPLLIVVAAMVWMQDGGPAFYGQMRRGRDGRLFRCLKFRSMVMDSAERLNTVLATDPVARAEWARDHKLRNDPRITRIGLFLRKSSLDELPQLFNVLFGQMNLVGPRPIVDAEIARYGWRYRYYCAVRPGITGLWQVSGRNDTTYRRRVALDVIYAQSKGLGLDFKILFMTIPAVLLRKGSY